MWGVFSCSEKSKIEPSRKSKNSRTLPCRRNWHTASRKKNWELIIIVFEIGFLFISMMDQLDYSINRKTNLIQKI
ncbi:hypothetical protein DORLON_03032 [Dorea longicatena DSM 13814]|uniref:Uncharacterized protein n=1 Tax=Dorea longicatena DSM 13814 TaxID=411462 RepID=A6BL14_9FIRM|nr:hypothetical protein DORLON_03032 [Dorea longicatena DSM 13814]